VAVESTASAERGEREPHPEVECFPDLLVVGLEDWDQVERRHQLLLREISRMHPECRILFVESPARLTLPRRLHDLALRHLTGTVAKIRIVRPLPEWTTAFHVANDAFEAVQLRRALSALGITNPLLWTKASRSIGLLDRLKVMGVVYDLTDDWAAAIESQPGRRKRLRLCLLDCPSQARLEVEPMHVPPAKCRRAAGASVPCPARARASATADLRLRRNTA
jgi:hypothetical protein